MYRRLHTFSRLNVGGHASNKLLSLFKIITGFLAFSSI